MKDAVIYHHTTANRLLIAEFLVGLDDGQWQQPTLCPGWNVHHMAAHLLQPMLVGFGQFFVTSLRYRGDTARVVDHVTRRLARRDRAEILTLLRRHADDRVSPARVGPMGPFAETCIHLRDIARPLTERVDVPSTHWQLLLDYLVSEGAAPGLVAPGRLDGLRLEASDGSWVHGSGEGVTGSSEALAMAITGRADALADLVGDGVARLRSQLASTGS